MPEDRLNPTSMLYWWPRVLEADVPKPRTEIVWTEPMQAGEMLLLCKPHKGDREQEAHWGCPDRFSDYVLDIQDAVLRVEGPPAFLRTDLFSGKHQWENTCHVPADSESLTRAIASRLHNLLEAQEMAFFPPPPDDVTVRAFVVRELLPVEPAFKAFVGMPITAERRYFVDDGKVLCHHPYWDDFENMARGVRYNPRPDNWADLLTEVNHEHAPEIELLTERSKQVADVMPGAWSVDWLRTKDGEWYLIDMAVAERSYHPEHAE